jgi:citrate lyase subunit beta/citryl-CoA lyase
MFVPGYSEKMIGKALASSVDVAILDLEDGVVPAQKPAARGIVAAALGAPRGSAAPQCYVRVNGPDTAEFAADLEGVVVPGCAGLVVPKMETLDQLSRVAAAVEALERARGIGAGTVRLMLAIETARGLLAAPSLAALVPRTIGLMFGAEDFSRDLGLPTLRSGTATQFIHARSSIVVAATAAGGIAIDGVWPDIKDLAGLAEDAALSRSLGLRGKSMVHPGNIDTVNSIFSPSAEELARARAVVADFEQAYAAGHGSISFAGMLIHKPIYERALATVHLAERIAARGVSA